jgi:signal transduction histidine kinase
MFCSMCTSREELQRIADEQAALRRVATLIARSTVPAEVLTAVTQEAWAVFNADAAVIVRRCPTRTAVVVARAGDDPDKRSVDRRWHTVASPIVVDGRLWGEIAVGSRRGHFPADSEERLADFSELVGLAITNAEGQAEAIASRARVVASADKARRRIERDLHDGTQQRLVAVAMKIRSVQATVPAELSDLAAELDDAVAGLTEALEELRELAHGIHPAILARDGLAPALCSLARRSAVPVDLDVRVEGSLARDLEVAAYYVVSEGLTNAAKHADAPKVVVRAEADAEVLRVSIHDDGVGGAKLAGGSGLIGLRDRVEALGGRMSLRSPRGSGTSLSVELPLNPT